MNYLKGGLGASSPRDEAMGMAQPLTPKSERPRSTYGSLSMSLQTLGGRCTAKKCVRVRDHSGDCWPKDKE